ncbi:hypothetical protein E2562_019201 [Oryza meyeriana var. granulata]|uniref:Uncharacterized protein n=1 Tax=Oryza meyeriana var. granulata TaxID=110450 RepID=A0A6G1FA70_9ORYZ|nr:hypothetical protein E2562_019201 [Oryza meyeriana var. granulata]
MELDLSPKQQALPLTDVVVAIYRAAEAVAALSAPSFSSQATAMVAALRNTHAADGRGGGGGPSGVRPAAVEATQARRRAPLSLSYKDKCVHAFWLDPSSKDGTPQH